MLGFTDTSTLEGHFVSSPREREKRDRRESRGDEREGQGRKRNRNEGIFKKKHNYFKPIIYSDFKIGLIRSLWPRQH